MTMLHNKESRARQKMDKGDRRVRGFPSHSTADERKNVTCPESDSPVWSGWSERLHDPESTTPEIGADRECPLLLSNRLPNGIAEAQGRSREPHVQPVEFFTKRGDGAGTMRGI